MRTIHVHAPLHLAPPAASSGKPGRAMLPSRKTTRTMPSSARSSTSDANAPVTGMRACRASTHVRANSPSRAGNTLFAANPMHTPAMRGRNGMPGATGSSSGFQRRARTCIPSVEMSTASAQQPPVRLAQVRGDLAASPPRGAPAKEKRRSPRSRRPSSVSLHATCPIHVSRGGTRPPPITPAREHCCLRIRHGRRSPSATKTVIPREAPHAEPASVHENRWRRPKESTPPVRGPPVPHGIQPLRDPPRKDPCGWRRRVMRASRIGAAPPSG